MREPSPIPPGERSGHRFAGGPIAESNAATPGEVQGRLVSVDGAEYYRIDGVDAMSPFLMSVTSSSDLWMFASSRASVTAGRSSADRALFPYETDDRIHRAVGITGPITVLARSVGDRRELWRPFGPDPNSQTRQSLAKAVQGDRLVFEEVHREWGLTFRSTWMPAPNFGWVRKVELINDSGTGVELEVLDGLLDVMPSGVDSTLEQVRSNLVDAYKRSETGKWGAAAVYTLEALITDRAEPAESLEATIVWSHGTEWAQLHLDERVVRAMLDDRSLSATNLLTGRRGAYLLRGRLSLGARDRTGWMSVADVGLDHATLRDRIQTLMQSDAPALLDADAHAGSIQLANLLASADGSQETGDPIADAHHLSNVLFNVMRGGVFPFGVQVPVSGLIDHLARWNREVHDRHSASVRALGESVAVEHLRRWALETDDAHLIRLVLEYLPLTFSRRHGDPSRPWNRFFIKRFGASDEAELGYEGNWRDIFQNWEALLFSYPSYLPNAVAKFVNASTVDGHNPYRISQDGFEWEAPDPHDPWGNIGYWGDHQIVYLHRLLSAWDRAQPGAISSWLDRRVFVYADVPYVLADYPSMVEDPRNTIEYDTGRAAEVEHRVENVGSDGRLSVAADGEIVAVGLLEKLLVPVLAKLTSFVPGGGIWLNTQRPEWNDANNALAGYGLSMVTLYYLRGYIEWLRTVVSSQGQDSFSLSRSVAVWMSDVSSTLQRADLRSFDDDRLRRSLMDEMGEVGSRYRRSVRREFDARPIPVARDDIDRLCGAALDHLSRTIDAARRDDGLYDAYNVVSFPDPETARVRKLGPMLEGQVAILSSGALGEVEACDLVDALYDSEMYRPDQQSFMLYPVPEVPSFVDRNTIPAERASEFPFLAELGPDVVTADAGGDFHFAAGMVNGAALTSALQRTGLSDEDANRLAVMYEEVFRHHSYTGRSGSMYGYEGIGSIYWHMVGKLLLAVQERYWAASDHGAAPASLERLAGAYRRIRAGLGFCKDPLEYGAIPIDCYSHTPAHAGAQQPGMTGQVKEEILTRFGELGLRIVDGRVALAPGLLSPAAVLDPRRGGQGEFTFCGVQVSVLGGTESKHRIRRDGLWGDFVAGLVVDAPTSTEIMQRGGGVGAIEFTVAGWTD